VLEDDEKELGVALIDIGGGTCDVMVYADGAIVHTSVLPLGGGHVTNDIATVLRTPLDSAEKIKRKYGCAWRGHVDDGEQREVPSVGGRGPRALQRMKLVEVIEPRIEEIFEHVKKELMRCGYFDGLAAGLVLTGGATAMDGMCEVAEQVLGLPTRRGVPTKIAAACSSARGRGWPRCSSRPRPSLSCARSRRFRSTSRCTPSTASTTSAATCRAPSCAATHPTRCRCRRLRSSPKARRPRSRSASSQARAWPSFLASVGGPSHEAIIA
jgi:cell division ATPase FtsA